MRNVQVTRILASRAARTLASSVTSAAWKTFKDGLILVGGAAADFNGMIPAVVTGRFAGQVAAEAIKAGDVSEASLKRYEDMWRKLGLLDMYAAPGEARRKVAAILASKGSDEDLANALKAMLQPGKPHPLHAASGPRRP